VKKYETFQRVTSVGFSLKHVHYVFFYLFCLAISTGPVVSCSSTSFAHKKVFGVIKIAELPTWVLYCIYYTRLKIYKQSAGNVVVIIGLIEEDVFSIVCSLDWVHFQNPFLVYAMLHA